MAKFSKIIFLFIMADLIILFFNFGLSSASAAESNIGCQNLQNFNYPWCGVETTSLGGLVSKFYLIALGLVGAAAFGVIIFGAVLYTVSAGNAAKQKDARDWITGAIWGVILLLAAYLILYTINPDLVNLREPTLTQIIIPPSQTITAPQQGQTEFWQGAIKCLGAGWLGSVACSGYTQQECTNNCQTTINDCTLGGNITTPCTKIRD